MGHTFRQTPHSSIFACANVLLLSGAVALWSAPAWAQASGATERRTDTEVKTLLDQIDEGRDKFEGNLEGSFKGSVLRDASREVSVEAALQDYQDNVKKLKERFTPEYSASAEVVTVLKQAERFDKFIQATPSLVKGRSEWEHHAADLKRLAAVYATAFPIQPGVNARRINDKETAVLANDIKDAADKVKDDFDKVPETALPKPQKDAVKKDLDLVKDMADKVKSRVGDHQPSTAEARQLITQVGVVQKFVDAHPTPSVATNWGALQAKLLSLEQAFNLK